MIRCALALLVLFTLVVPTRADNAQALANVKTIGIVSALGEELTLLYVGTTAFANKERTEAFPDLKLDEFVIAEFAAQLAGRYDVRPVAYDKADFYPETSGIFVRADLDVEERIQRVKPADGAAPPDVYIVVRKSVNDDYVMRTNQHLRGAGLYQRGFFGKRHDAIFVSGVVILVDGRTNKEIDSIVLLVPGGDSLFFDRTPTHKKVENLWDENFAMTPEQRSQLREAFHAILRESIAMSLQRLELVPKE